MRVDVEIHNIPRFLKTFDQSNIDKIVDKILETTSMLLKEIMIGILPVRTGNLLRSLRENRVSRDRIDIVLGDSNAPYARMLLYGTRPHLIYPKRARALRFISEDGTVFARKVLHPGYRGVRYPEIAIKMMLPDLQQLIAMDIKEVFED